MMCFDSNVQKLVSSQDDLLMLVVIKLIFKKNAIKHDEYGMG